MHNSAEILSRYFRQQAELYPGEYYFSSTNITPAGPVVGVREPEIAEMKMPEPKARELTLAELAAKLSRCADCELAGSRRNVVFGSGNEKADLMFIGPAPGTREDETGLPFMDEAGELFDNILKAIQLKRTDVYLTNLLKCSPGERKAHKEEMSLCLEHLKQQIRLVNPKLIVCLGRTVAQTLLNSSKNLDELRGSVWKFENYDVMVTYHPAACLHNAENKRPTWDDFKLIQKIYKEKTGR